MSTGDAKTTFKLKVISPSPELDGGIIFNSLAVVTTVSQLKLQIRERVSSKPSPEQQRLIYRGHVLVDNDASMADVFGAEVR